MREKNFKKMSGLSEMLSICKESNKSLTESQILSGDSSDSTMTLYENNNHQVRAVSVAQAIPPNRKNGCK